jgi:hypothetical protein
MKYFIYNFVVIFQKTGKLSTRNLFQVLECFTPQTISCIYYFLKFYNKNILFYVFQYWNTSQNTYHPEPFYQEVDPLPSPSPTEDVISQFRAQCGEGQSAHGSHLFTPVQVTSQVSLCPPIELQVYSPSTTPSLASQNQEEMCSQAGVRSTYV